MPRGGPSTSSDEKTTLSDYGSDLSDTKSRFCPRPGPGNTGRRIQIYANYFPLRFDKNTVIFHYDIDLEPVRLSAGGDEIMSKMQELAIDQKSKRYRKGATKVNRLVLEEAVRNYSAKGQLFHNILPVYDGKVFKHQNII